MQSYISPVEDNDGPIELRPGQERYSYRWSPCEAEPWASLTIIHGFGDHAGRFRGMGLSLASLGIAVHSIDLIGHGRSPGRRGCIDSYEQLLDDVESAHAWTLRNWPNVPQFLFGQSMGGNLVLNWAIRRSHAVRGTRGIIAGSPMLRAGTMPKERMMDAGRWLATKVPNWRIRTPVHADKLSHDRRAQDAFQRDRLVHRSMSLRLATALIDSGQWALDHAGELDTPTLLMHGGEDTLTCPKASAQFAQHATRATFRSWPGCRHDLHDDLQREQVFEYLMRWMKERCIVSYRVKRPALHAA